MNLSSMPMVFGAQSNCPLAKQKVQNFKNARSAPRRRIHCWGYAMRFLREIMLTCNDIWKVDSATVSRTERRTPCSKEYRVRGWYHNLITAIYFECSLKGRGAPRPAKFEPENSKTKFKNLKTSAPKTARFGENTISCRNFLYRFERVLLRDLWER